MQCFKWSCTCDADVCLFCAFARLYNLVSFGLFGVILASCTGVSTRTSWCICRCLRFFFISWLLCTHLLLFLFLPDYDVVLLSVYVVRLLVFFAFLCAVGLFVSVCSSLLRFKFAGVSNADAERVRWMDLGRELGLGNSKTQKCNLRIHYDFLHVLAQIAMRTICCALTSSGYCLCAHLKVGQCWKNLSQDFEDQKEVRVYGSVHLFLKLFGRCRLISLLCSAWSTSNLAWSA